MDIQRAEYCRDDIDITYAREYNRSNQTVQCEDIGREYIMTCGNGTGIVELTCPARFSTGVCRIWDYNKNEWASDYCEQKSYDFDEGSVTCNCSRLGSFSGQQSSAFTPKRMYSDSLNSKEKHRDVSERRRNNFIIYVVVATLVCFCAIFFYRDMVARRLVRMNNLAKAFKSPRPRL